MATGPSPHVLRGARLVIEIPFPRAFVVWALRQWVWPGPTAEGRQRVACAFDRLGAADAWPHFEAMVSVWGAASRRPITIPPPCCPAIERDEALFADALALIQCGCPQLAASHWQRDLPACAVEHLLVHATRLAARLEAVGLLLDTPIGLPVHARPADHALH